ncbi:hypothetical protein EPIR_3124 [Erwinia piriflorinigrans CFBP 5888]|uniref:Uncharacterized protein n=1 Tax=Erwinia piriflorinigrans CFBP 5888 TaxID=1161919 RepID=V5ZBV8_9GAMM|nr:hypothetical protein EPIR_3124 [Erwinia piriflorinigrans CFBP 5888]
MADTIRRYKKRPLRALLRRAGTFFSDIVICDTDGLR